MKLLGHMARRVERHLQAFSMWPGSFHFKSALYSSAKLSAALAGGTLAGANRPAAALSAGVTAPPAPSPSELGWTGSLPHPTQYTPAGDAEQLKEQAKEVRGYQAGSRCSVLAHAAENAYDLHMLLLSVQYARAC
jgi:hypothetical protein